MLQKKCYFRINIIKYLYSKEMNKMKVYNQYKFYFFFTSTKRTNIYIKTFFLKIYIN